MKAKATDYTIAAICVLALNTPFAWSADDSQRGWILKQKHITNGRQSLFVSPKKLRIDNMDTGYSMIADAPRGTLTLHNKSKQLRITIPITEFNSKLARAFVYIGA